jgi:hypothetical protein
MAVKTTSLIVDVRPGERLNLSGAASVELVHKSGQLVRLRIIAPLDVTFEKVSSQQHEVVPSMTVSTPSKDYLST